MSPQPTNIKLKVCGLTQLNQIQKLIEMHINFLGFIFYKKSPRYVLNHLTLEEISAINHHGKTGIFVNEEIENILKTVQKAGLNFIQLHGNETNDFIYELNQKLNREVGIIKVIRVGNDISTTQHKIIQHLTMKAITYYLFDTDSKAFGGTGKQFDWKILNTFEIPIPYFLSGGISEYNVGKLSTLKQLPFALDINSKFEIEPGYKNISHINKFKLYISKKYKN